MVDEIEVVENPATKEDSYDKNKNQKSKSRPNKKILIAAVIGLIAVSVGVHSYIQSTKYVSTDDAYIEGHTVQLAPKVSGNISKVYVDDNQKVKEGQIIAEIDPKDYKVQYDQAVARLEAAIEKQKGANANLNYTSITSIAGAEQANSGVDVAKANIQIASKQISQANANLEQVNHDIESVKADLNLAQIEFHRNEKLYKKGVVSKQDFDRASTNLKTVNEKLNSTIQRASGAKANLQSAYANRDSSVKSLNIALGKFKGANTVKEQVAMSNAANKAGIAEIKQLKAAVEQAKINLSYTKIYALQNGSVTNKSVEKGSYVQIGQPLLSIVPEKRWIIANFKETQLNNMRVGQPVIIKVDAYSGKVFKGRIDSIQSASGAKSSLFPPENAVGSFVKVVQRVPVKITFSEKFDPRFAIVPGMSVIPEVKVK